MSNHKTASTTQMQAGLDWYLRPGAKALVRSSGAVLLVKERHSDGTPFWTLPGGGVEPGEEHRTALRRELNEELGCQGVVGQSVDTIYYAHQSCSRTLSAYRVFECSLVGEPTPCCVDGIRAVEWVQPGSLPAYTLPQVEWVVRRWS